MSCLDCEHFTWWDGDYVCMHYLEILFYSENGGFENITAIEPRAFCDHFRKSRLCLYRQAYEKWKRERNGKH